MKFIFSSLLSLCLITTHLFGQSSERPQSIVIPISSIGEVTETRKQILQNTLTQELSKHFQILPQDQFERVQEKVFEELDYDECTEDQCIVRIQEVLQIENVFNLQVIGEEGDTQLNLKWMNLDEKKNKEDYCEGCKTKELRKRVKVLVGRLIEVSETNSLVSILSDEKPITSNEKTTLSNEVINPNKKTNLTLYRERDREVWEREGKKWFRLGDDLTMNRYEGETLKGIPNGYGYILFTNGDTFEGKFIDGEYIEGRYVFKSGSIYDGSFNNEKLDGIGDYKFKNGDIYIGRFSMGLKNGEGVYTWKNGDRYDGFWEKDKKNGSGTFIYKNGQSRIGVWKNDKFWSGRLISEDNKKIINLWENGKKVNPKGILFKKYSNNLDKKMKWYNDGDLNKDWKYNGEILNNIPNGKGILTYQNEKYDGYFQNGLFHGYGEFTYKNGGIFKGEWISGKRHGEGKYYSPNGDTYIGKWRNGKQSIIQGYDKNGNIILSRKGILYISGGRTNRKLENDDVYNSKYVGEIFNGVPHGRGILTTSNGQEYDGEWKNGKEDGKGTFTYLNGDRFEGIYKNGKRWNGIDYNRKMVVKGKVENGVWKPK